MISSSPEMTGKSLNWVSWSNSGPGLLSLSVRTFCPSLLSTARYCWVSRCLMRHRSYHRTGSPEGVGGWAGTMGGAGRGRGKEDKRKRGRV